MNPQTKYPALETTLQSHPSRWTPEAIDLAEVVATLEGDKTPTEWIQWLDEMGRTKQPS